MNEGDLVGMWAKHWEAGGIKSGNLISQEEELQFQTTWKVSIFCYTLISAQDFRHGHLRVCCLLSSNKLPKSILALGVTPIFPFSKNSVIGSQNHAGRRQVLTVQPARTEVQPPLGTLAQ